MGSVIDMINAAAPRKQPTTSDIVSLASGQSTSRSAKKPRSSSTTRKSAAPKSKSPKAKAPCKYGPRDADGYCPKKPAGTSARTTSRNRTKVTAKSGSAAADQALDVLTNPRATSEQKSAAVSQVGAAVVTDAAKSTVRKNKSKIVAAVKKHGGTVAGVVIPVAIAAAAAKQIPKQRKKEAKKFADKELAKTKKRMGAQITPEIAATLWQQYYDFKLKEPVKNSFVGK